MDDSGAETIVYSEDTEAKDSIEDTPSPASPVNAEQTNVMEGVEHLSADTNDDDDVDMDESAGEEAPEGSEAAAALESHVEAGAMEEVQGFHGDEDAEMVSIAEENDMNAGEQDIQSLPATVPAPQTQQPMNHLDQEDTVMSTVVDQEMLDVAEALVALAVQPSTQDHQMQDPPQVLDPYPQQEAPAPVQQDMQQSQQVPQVPQAQQAQETKQTVTANPLEQPPQPPALLPPSTPSSGPIPLLSTPVPKRKAEDELPVGQPQKKAKAATDTGSGGQKTSGLPHRPVPGPNQRRIFRVAKGKVVGYDLISLPNPYAAACPPSPADASSPSTAEHDVTDPAPVKPACGTLGRKRLNDIQGLNKRGYCTVETLLRAWDVFEGRRQHLRSEINAVVSDVGIQLRADEAARRGQVAGRADIADDPKCAADLDRQLGAWQRVEADAYARALHFAQPVPDMLDEARPRVFETFVRGKWVQTPVTTFRAFLAQRVASRPALAQAWSAHDAVQVAMEYLVLRFPLFMVSTNAVLDLLQARFAALLDRQLDLDTPQDKPAEKSARTTVHSVLSQWPHARNCLYSRRYATELYASARRRLFLWMMRGAGDTTPRRAVHGWAAAALAACKRDKCGQAQDVWRIVSRDDGRLVVDWRANEAPRSPAELRAWFAGWLEGLVAPIVRGLCSGDQGQRLVAERVMTVLRQQLDAEITSWLLDFPGWGADEKGSSTTAGSSRMAMDDIIRQASAPKQP